MKQLERVYPWILLSPVILPVVLWGGLIYPYLVPKTLLFYTISLIAMGMFVVLVAHGRAFFWARIKQWEAWIPGALLVVAYITSAWGIDFYRSFWSLFVRGDGLLMLTCAVSSFYLILFYADRAFFVRLVRAVAIVASGVAVYGIGEALMGGGRIGSLLGNAAFFAGYLGLAFFATLLAARTLSKPWRQAAHVGAVLQVIAIILTATRGTMLALAVAGIAFLAYIALKRSPLTPGKTSAGSGVARIALLTLVIIGIASFALRSELAKVPFEPVARIASISFSDGTVSSRLFIWKNMLTEIGKSPWSGVGAEHIDVLFNRFYDPTQISEQWFDRSHNAFLDYAAQYGIGGLLLYLALIAAFITTATRLVRRKGDTHTAGIFALLAITYAIQNFFVFDTVSSFWLFLALLAIFISISQEETSPEVVPFPSWMRSGSWFFALVLGMLIIPVSLRPALAAYDLMEAYKYQLVDVPKEVSYLSHGIALGTYADLEYGYEAYDMYANTQVLSLMGQSRVDAYQSTLAILTAAFNRYPYDARTALYLAHVLTLAPQGVTIDRDLLSSALDRAIRFSPKRSQSWYVLANLSISNANEYPPQSSGRTAGYAAAEDILTKYIAMVPTLSAPHYVLAELLYASGRNSDAGVEATKGKVNYVSDLETAKRAVGYYETVLDLPNAAFFLKEVVRLDPGNTGAASDLAKIQSYESR